MRRTLVRCMRIHDKNGVELPLESIAGKHLLIYFSASWCPPCRHFTPLLAKFYEAHKDKKNFEVIFASWDSDEASFRKYHSEHHPWPAIVYSERKIVERFQEQFNVVSIPTLVVLSPEGELLTKCGREMVLKDPEATEFPWRGVVSAPGGGITRMLMRVAVFTCVFLLLLWWMGHVAPPSSPLPK